MTHNFKKGEEVSVSGTGIWFTERSSVHRKIGKIVWIDGNGNRNHQPLYLVDFKERDLDIDASPVGHFERADEDVCWFPEHSLSRFCEKHGEVIVYHDSREEHFCPFCEVKQ